jgi:hypothetical protein
MSIWQKIRPEEIRSDQISISQKKSEKWHTRNGLQNSLMTNESQFLLSHQLNQYLLRLQIPHETRRLILRISLPSRIQMQQQKNSMIKRRSKYKNCERHK